MEEVVRFLEKLRCLVDLRHDVKDLLKQHERGLARIFPACRPLPEVMSAKELLSFKRPQLQNTFRQVPDASSAGSQSSASGQVPQEQPAAQSPASGQVPVAAKVESPPDGKFSASGQVPQEKPGAQSPAFGQAKEEPAPGLADWGSPSPSPAPDDGDGDAAALSTAKSKASAKPPRRSGEEDDEEEVRDTVKKLKA